MAKIGRPGLSPEKKAELWERWKSGQCASDIARSLERNKGAIHHVLAFNGGIAPVARRRGPVALMLDEREEISRGIAGGESIRRIAASLGRSPSTVSREVARHGGRRSYRATEADARAWELALRPKPCRLASHPELRWRVAEKLALDWSPEQVSGWLKREFPADKGLRVSHETIYRSLFVQARGVLKKELLGHLRARRRMRYPKGGTTPSRLPGQIVDAISIRERPAEIEDRAVPGHFRHQQLAHGDAGRAPFPLRDAAQGTGEGYRQRGFRPQQTGVQATSGAAPLIDLGSGQGDGRPQELHDRHRRAGLFLRSAQPVAARQQR